MKQVCGKLEKTTLMPLDSPTGDMTRYKKELVLLVAWSLSAVFSSAGLEAQEANDYRQAMAQWHADREAQLKGPNGWLNLAGLYWLEPGVNTFGSAPDSDIVLAEGSAAARLGEFLLEEGNVTFRVEPGTEVFSNGETVTELPLVHDEAGEPTLLTHRSLGWYAIRRMERMGVRLRDYNHPFLEQFPGIESFPPDLQWRVQAKFIPYDEPRHLQVMTVVEGLGWDPVAPGTLEFEIRGEPMSLEAYRADDGLFVIFADLTMGETTYPAGRYLDAEAPGPDGTTILDFNKAYNPPCAFNEFATCPLPTRRNFLQMAIEAGEKYAKGLHALGI